MPRKQPTDPAEIFVLALDLSLNGPGAAVLAVGADSVRIAEVAYLRTNQRANRGERERAIVDWATALDAKYPTMERVYAKEDAPPSPVTGAILNRVHGAIEAGFAPRDWVDIPQGTVKAIVVGRGGSDVEKDDVERAVRAHLVLDEALTFANSDESDAVSVGLAYLALAEALPNSFVYERLRGYCRVWLTMKPNGKPLEPKERAKRAKFAESVRKKFESGVKVA
jgi:Holliday junction resolvasome RuvABC endonuclease subunit